MASYVATVTKNRNNNKKNDHFHAKFANMVLSFCCFENVIMILILIMIMHDHDTVKYWKEKAIHGEFARQTSDAAKEVSWRCSRMFLLLLLLFVLFFKKGT